MKSYYLLFFCSLIALCSTSKTESPEKEIIHTVVFTLKHEKGSSAAIEFLETAHLFLTGIDVVRDFTIRDQISPKSDFQYGFYMVFTDMEAYTTYNNHPDHIKFVNEYWEKQVVDFQELDFKVIEVD